MDLHAQEVIVGLLADGKRAKDIAAEIYKSSRTIETYIQRMLFMYDCKTQAHLVATFLRTGKIV